MDDRFPAATAKAKQHRDWFGHSPTGSSGGDRAEVDQLIRTDRAWYLLREIEGAFGADSDHARLVRVCLEEHGGGRFGNEDPAWKAREDRDAWASDCAEATKLAEEAEGEVSKRDELLETLADVMQRIASGRLDSDVAAQALTNL